MVKYLPQLLDAFMDQVIAEKPTALVLSGDITMNGEKILHPSASEGSAHPCGSVHRSALSFRSSCVFPPYILYTIRKYAIRFYQHNTFWIFWQAYFFCRFTFKPANPCIYWRFR